MIIPIAAALVVSLYLFIKKTRIGAAMRAIEQDKEAAALQGVNVHVVNALAFAIGFALAAAAGALARSLFLGSVSDPGRLGSREDTGRTTRAGRWRRASLTDGLARLPPFTASPW